MTIGTLILWNVIRIGMIIITILTHFHTIIHITTGILIPISHSLFRSTIRTTSIILIILIMVTIIGGIHMTDTIIADGGANSMQMKVALNEKYPECVLEDEKINKNLELLKLKISRCNWFKKHYKNFCF
jgi:hypothetical protein